MSFCVKSFPPHINCKQSLFFTSIPSSSFSPIRGGSRGSWAEFSKMFLSWCQTVQRSSSVWSRQAMIPSIPSVRFSKFPKIRYSGAKTFRGSFWNVYRVTKSVSQSAIFSPEIIGNLFGICGAKSSSGLDFPACDWCKDCRLTSLHWVSSRLHQNSNSSKNRRQRFHR